MTDITREAVIERLIEIATAPIYNPEIAPSVLPLVIGGFLIELYFGKHQGEELGWNTSVANGGLWLTTGLGIFITRELSKREQAAVIGLVAAGAFIVYMNFFHKWDKSTAFRISSAGTIYTAAYIITVLTGTDIPVNKTTGYASVLLAAAVILGFKVVKALEKPQNENNNTLLDQ